MPRMGIELPVGTKFLAQLTGHREPIECQVVLHDEKKWKSCRESCAMYDVCAGRDEDSPIFFKCLAGMRSDKQGVYFKCISKLPEPPDWV